jgi:hypothetical protein
MPLSEHEQRLLEQMERALYADDPKFASSLRNAKGHGYDRRRLVLGAVAVAAGIGLLLGGVAIPLWPLGVAGFLVMLTGAWLALAGWRARPAAGTAKDKSGAPAASRRQRGFMNRMEDRWQRRQEGDQGR